MTTPEEILGFWFADSLTNDAALDRHLTRWFQRDKIFDLEILNRFGDDITRAGRGEFDWWKDSARGRLALIILLDQLARNAFRNSAKAYAFDAHARNLCHEGLTIGADRELGPVERLFFYLPLLHSEDLQDQQQSVECFERLLAQAPSGQTRQFAGWIDVARRQRGIIKRLGRFPHRNAALGRASTPAEQAFLVLNTLQAIAGHNLRLIRRELTWILGP
jgi:uncharacterized protein (DUF924 family)